MNTRRTPGLIALLFICLYAWLPTRLDGANLKDYTVENVYIQYYQSPQKKYTKLDRYHQLLFIKPGDTFSSSAVRKSMETLYSLGTIDNIEIKVRKKSLLFVENLGSRPDNLSLDLYFIIFPKHLIRNITIKQKALNAKGTGTPRAFDDGDFRSALFSLRRGTYFENEHVVKARKEAGDFLRSRGFYSPVISENVIKNAKNLTVDIQFDIETGSRPIVKQIDLTVTRPELQEDIHRMINVPRYIPYEFQKKIKKIREYLTKRRYFSPEIIVTPHFTGESHENVKLAVTVNPGYQYQFKFIGIKDRFSLISTLWTKKVFEQWAQQESRRRILLFLRNKGYLNADVQSKIETANGVKTITFTVVKNRKYRLGKIYFIGNHSVPEKTLRKIIQVDDLIYEKFFHVRLQSLIVDREIVRLHYYLKEGFPSARVRAEPRFKGNKADIYFIIDEGNRYTVDSIEFKGNRFFPSRELSRGLRTKVDGPFVQQKLNEDLDEIRTRYHSKGFDKIDVTADISEGSAKSVVVQISEGTPYRMGNLIAIGASSQQRKLVEKRFPLKNEQPYDQLRVDAFRAEMDTSGVFSQFDLSKIERDNGVIDVLVHLKPDRSRFYGFGIGLLEREHFRDFQLRGTLEFQERNIFGSYSSFSAMLQWSPQEKRGLLAYDTPFFFKTRIKSSLRVWADKEIFPSYTFDRYGISGTLIKNIGPTASLSGSLSWYRTTLTSLEIVGQDKIDTEDDPFDTTALNLSFVNEGRDDPFNPTEGNFMTSYVKLGVPIFERDYFFAKLWWGFQQNFKLLKNGTVAVTVRNGLATDGISITERFFAGGFNTFRGAWTDRLGPRDPVTGKPFGGRAFLLLNFETTFPILLLPVKDFYYSIFADVGNVFKNVKDFNMSKLKTALGLSLKYKTPLGPLRFDLGWDLATGVPRLHIGIGNML